MPAHPLLKYVIFYVENLDRALTFYTEVFGFKEKMRQGPYAEVETGATTLAFTERTFVAEHIGVKPATKESNASEIGVVVRRESVKTYYRKALDAGAKSVKDPQEQPWGQIVSYIRDPDGHLVEICSPND